MSTIVPSTITIAYARSQRDAALQALETALRASSVSSGGRSVTTQSLSELRETVAFWERTIKRITEETAGAVNPGISVAQWNHNF